jgi:hypothetical protein
LQDENFSPTDTGGHADAAKHSFPFCMCRHRGAKRNNGITSRWEANWAGISLFYCNWARRGNAKRNTLSMPDIFLTWTFPNF